jgi:hypothetical protein
MKIKNLFLMLLTMSLAFVACDNSTENEIVPVPTYDIDMKMDAALAISNEETGLAEDKISIIFGDSAQTTALKLTFVSSNGDNKLTVGTYSSSNGGILLDHSSLELYSKSGSAQTLTLSEANAVVTIFGDDFSFDIKATANDGKKCHFTYFGAIYEEGNNDEPTDTIIVNNNFACGFYEGSGSVANNYYVVLANVKINDDMDVANATYCIFDLYSSVNSGTVPNGTYTLDSKNSGKAGTTGAEYTYVYNTDSDGKYESLVEFTEGTVTVSDKKIEAVMTTAEGVTYTIIYEGSLTFDAISTLSDDLYLDSTTIDIVTKQYEWSDASLTNWTIELFDDFDAKSGLYMVVDILCDANASDYSGTYNASYMGNVNSFFPGSVDEGYLVGSYLTMLLNNNPTGTNAPISTGSITIVCNADGTETFTFNCEDDKGNKITGTLTGSRVALN